VARLTSIAAVLILFATVSSYAQTEEACVIETVLGGVVFAGEGTPASQARFLGPRSIAVRTDGSLVIADSRNHRIRQIDPQGIIRTVAGSGTAGASGDGGPAVEATVTHPEFLALRQGAIGLLGEDGRLREITVEGNMRSVTETIFDGALSLAAGPDGSYYVGMIGASFRGVQRVFPDGSVAIFAGNGKLPASAREGEGLPATQAPVGIPRDLAVDAEGRVWIAESYPTGQIRRVEIDGRITTIAGGGSQAVSSTPLDAREASLPAALDIALIPGGGQAYVLANSSLLRLAGGRIEAVEDWERGDITIDAAGALYLLTGERIVRRATDGEKIQIAGPPAPDYAAASIAMETPVPWFGVGAERDEGLLLHLRGAIYRWRPGAEAIEKIAGNGRRWNGENEVPALQSGFNSIRQLAADPEGGIYVADDDVSQLRYIDPSGTVHRAAGGNGAENQDTHIRNPTPALDVLLNRLDSVSVGPDGVVYFSETFSTSRRNRVFRLDAGGLLQEYVLQPGIRMPDPDIVVGAAAAVAYVLDRPGRAMFRLGDEGSDIKAGPPIHPALASTAQAMAVDEEGSLYWTDSTSRILWRLRPNGSTERLSSLGIAASEAEGAPPLQSRIVVSQTFSISRAGDLYFPDSSAGRVRRIRNVSSCPGAPHPLIDSDGVVSGASFLGRQAIAPGEIISLFGVNLGPNTLAAGRLDENGRLATEASGVRVLVDGTPAPIVFASAGQTTFVTPNEIEGRVSLVVENDGHRNDDLGYPFAFELSTATALPGLFATGFQPDGWQAAALNQDGSVNGSSNPARAGEAIVLYATGVGRMTPELPTGSIVGAELPHIVAPVRVEIGGQDAEVLYAGGAPGLVYGVAQINALIPADLTATGSVRVQLFVDSAVSREVKIEVQP
jgi:uncharacterized protein (TIGR03437 family)